jgi:hypothetical protein
MKMRSVNIQVDIAQNEKFADEIYNREKKEGNAVGFTVRD